MWHQKVNIRSSKLTVSYCNVLVQYGWMPLKEESGAIPDGNAFIVTSQAQ